MVAVVGLVSVAFTLGATTGLRRSWPLAGAYEWLSRQASPYDFRANPSYRIRSALYAVRKSRRITMIGDSLTEYADWSLLLGRPDVGNQGITGDVSAGVLARLYPSVTGSQVVFLNIGINDPAHFVTAMETQANIRHIVEVLSRGSKVYVQSLILTRRSDLNRYVQVTNEFLQMFCDGKMCTYVDLNARLAKDGMLNESFALDAVHLNENGYLQWAAAIAPLI
ncbi:GDSL-type esterase/lipase family protein [Bradyrhizobium sp. BR 10289]|uniref:GDSL-type esterase/lipase family protein n=1 Tax=Bradyrhizobium sp. BR 10289 TaxID=2749993 RepID=UPI001C6510EF|nr:hypothetical protein [Bradyrhizobium sp. BR 10289]